MIEFFPGIKQQQIRSIIAGVLRGVVSQRLLPRVGGGRVAAVEVMVNNARIAELIRENKSDEITDAIDEGDFFDMQTFQQALIQLVARVRSIRRSLRTPPRTGTTSSSRSSTLSKRRMRPSAKRSRPSGEGRARAAGRRSRRMRKLLLLAAALVALGTASTAGASGPVSTIVPSSRPTTAFASAEIPNSGSSCRPPVLSPRDSEGLPLPGAAGLLAARRHRLRNPWQVLAAINKVESNFGRNMGPSSAGAIGWMQFMPSTWERWGMDADGDGIADPWNPQDAIFSAARYLAAAGGSTDISRGVFAYNHAQWYVDEVLGLARLYGQNGTEVPFVYDRLQGQLQAAQRTVARQNRLLVKATLVERALARRARALDARRGLGTAPLDRLELQKDAFQMDARRAGRRRRDRAARHGAEARRDRRWPR